MKAPIIVSCLLASAMLPAFHAGGQSPEQIPGMVAWYRTDGNETASGGKVDVWKDHSGQGHDLTSDGKGIPAAYRGKQLGTNAAIEVGKANAYTVATPFTLEDHTIFLVYRASQPGKALFRSGEDPYYGVILRVDRTHDLYQNGGINAAQLVDYNTESPYAGFGITALGREGNRLRSFVNGQDVSSGAKLDEPVRVGKFFHLQHTTYSKSDGEGLKIAEMIFYGRSLSDAERAAVTLHLSSKFGIEIEAASSPGAIAGAGDRFAALAQLSTTFQDNVNASGVPIPWDIQDDMDVPFEHVSKGERATRLVCAQDNTRVRLFVSLPLTSQVEGANVRALFRVNGTEFLRGEGRSGVLDPARGQGKGSVTAEVVKILGAGDYVEVITLQSGAAGTVTIDSASAVFVAELK